jgi:tetratricopeptide (TPR) repeat protein
MLRALRYAPAAGSAHARYGWALMMNRRYEEARAAYAEALALDPLSLLYRAHQALIDLYAREFEAARRRLDAVLEVAPDHLVANALAAALHLYAGRLDDGRLAYQGIAERFPRLSIGRCGLGQALALQGDRAGAQQQLDWLRATFDAGFVSPYQIAMVHARLGDAAAAIEWLARAAQLRDFNFVCVGVDPAFDALRPLPAFRQLLAGNGFGHLGGE